MDIACVSRILAGLSPSRTGARFVATAALIATTPLHAQAAYDPTAPAPDNVAIVYRGDYQGAVVVHKQLRGTISFGDILASAAGEQHQVSGQIELEITYFGNHFQGRWRATGPLDATKTFVGTRNGTTCELDDGTDSPGSVAEFRCTASQFIGKMVNGPKAPQQANITFTALADPPRPAPPPQPAYAAPQAAYGGAPQQSAQEQAAAAQASYAALPNAGPLLTRKLDSFVITDSRGWAFNRYAPGSMRDVKIVSGSIKSGDYVLKGFFSYASGNQGWVMAQMHAGNLVCIQFWDAVIGCRGLRTPEQGQAMRNAAVGVLTGSGGGGSSGHCDGQTGEGCSQREINDINEDRFIQYRNQQNGQ